MRTIFLTLLILVSAVLQAQTSKTSTEDPIAAAKAEFRKQAASENSDYTLATHLFTELIKTYPDSPEVYYFLGYSIDRLNANDGSLMHQSKRSMTVKASEQFEKVIKLSPTYRGELVILDPYGKLTSIWGSLAQAYLAGNKTDSAKWAFTEGKRRGAFAEPFLEFNRQLLANCDSNAILVSYGDMLTVPIWYLQTIENFRRDVSMVDANLLNAAWYVKNIKKSQKIKLSMSEVDIDSVDYKEWDSRIIKITNPNNRSDTFSWELKPTYMGSYVLRSDLVMLDILQNNLFARPIYFMNDADTTNNLHLGKKLINEGLIDRLVTKQGESDRAINNLKNYSIARIKPEEIARSKDAIILLNSFRWAYFNRIYALASIGEYEKAKQLINQMRANFPKEKLPFSRDEFEKYFNDYFEEVSKQ